MKNGDMPAQALSGDAYYDFAHYLHTKDASYNPEGHGLTKREMFAMHIMAGMAAQSHGYTSYNLMAQDAVEQANALLSVLGESK